MATMLIDKPSRLHNLSYLLLGYYVSSVITYSLDLSFDQKILVITAFGSFIGALIFYIKPIEQIMAIIIRLGKRNRVWPVPPDEEFSRATIKTDVLLSSYLADERTKVNGAFFMAIGILVSYSFFSSMNLYSLYLFFQVFTGILIVIGLYESYVLLRRKLPIVVSFYTYYSISQYTDLLKKAIQRKDWIEAEKIRDKEPDLDNEYPEYYYYPKIPDYGLCFNCGEVREGRHCTKCGEHITKLCASCKSDIITDKNASFPDYCKYCGKKIEKVSG